jgi:hypothetical protein
MNDLAAAVGSLAWQRVVYERPPQGTLMRGLFSFPPAPVAALVLAAVAAAVGSSLARRRRR